MGDIKERDIKKLKKISEELNKLTERIKKYNPEAHIVAFGDSMYIATEEMKNDHPLPSGFCAPGRGYEDRDDYENNFVGGFYVKSLVSLN